MRLVYGAAALMLAVSLVASIANDGGNDGANGQPVVEGRAVWQLPAVRGADTGWRDALRTLRAEAPGRRAGGEEQVPDRDGPKAEQEISDAEPTPETPEAAFRRGYAEVGGPAELLEHFLLRVLPCEGGPTWGRADYGNGYIGRPQFHPGTWAQIEAALGELDAASPYDLGRAVGFWINAIGPENIATRGGWPVCGRR